MKSVRVFFGALLIVGGVVAIVAMLAFLDLDRRMMGSWSQRPSESIVMEGLLALLWLGGSVAFIVAGVQISLAADRNKKQSHPDV